MNVNYMKTVVFFTGSMRRGGAERVISVLANYLVRHGWRVCIVSLLFKGVMYDLDPSIECVDFSNESRNQIIDIPRMLWRVRKFVSERKPYVIISFMVKINILVRFATFFLKTPFISSERNDPTVGRNFVLKILQNFVYAHSSAVVFQTDFARNYFSKKIQKKSVVIPNPVSMAVNPTFARKNVIVSVGRLEPQKNQKLLIDAFFDVHKKYPNYNLDIYGEGSLRNCLQEQINSLNLNDVVCLKGNVCDVQNCIKDAKIFALTSNYEGMSNALIEAMCLGLSCVSTKCCGSFDIISDNIDGLLVDVNDKEGLVNALLFYIENEIFAKKCAQKANEKAFRYSVEEISKKWIRLIEKISIEKMVEYMVYAKKNKKIIL